MYLIPSKVLYRKNMKTPSAACASTALLWDNIAKDARTGILPKGAICIATFSRNVAYACPCCEYAALRNRNKLAGRCEFCPMLDFWNIDFSENRNKVNIACDRSGSPYNKWGIAAMGASPETGNFSYSFAEEKMYAKMVRDAAVDAYFYWEAIKEMNVTW